MIITQYITIHNTKRQILDIIKPFSKKGKLYIYKINNYKSPEELLNEGKPADKIENILVGKVRKYYEEVCLENQIFVKAENKETVSKYLENNGAKLVSMIRYEVGEGIEKRQDNFAEEVMNQVNG